MQPIDPRAIDALLPQTQCTQCGFAGCMPYAEAITAGSAPINRCAPGGDDGIHRLAKLTGQSYAPLDPAHGVHKPRLLAVIDEARCIGCTICIQKCPVDAIAGAAKLMHTVIADECTGCELCVAPCPVDCIALVDAPRWHPALADPMGTADRSRERFRSRNARLARIAAVTVARRAAAPARVTADAVNEGTGQPATYATTDAAMDRPIDTATIGSVEHKRDTVAAALARARARRAGLPSH